MSHTISIEQIKEILTEEIIREIASSVGGDSDKKLLIVYCLKTSKCYFRVQHGRKPSNSYDYATHKIDEAVAHYNKLP